MKVQALKPVSHREALGKVVRLLTRQGVTVQFRGSKAFVAYNPSTKKVDRMVLPEIGDNISPTLLRAIHGFLDHECGHMFYTPFQESLDWGNANGGGPMHSLLNIIEDIRLEKLLPRDLPGTAENLTRMYEEFIPKMIDPAVKSAVSTGDPSKAFFGVTVPAMRALAGQHPFCEYMDQNNLWPHFAVLLQAIPNLSTRLKAMETFDDVKAIAKDIFEAIKAASPNQQMPAMSQDDDDGDDGDDQSQQPSNSDEGSDQDNASEGDEGDGDGEGSSSEDAENDDDCSGSDAGDDSGDDEGEGAEGGDEEGGDDGNSSKRSDEDQEGDGGSSGDGKKNLSITDALKQLEPTQRRALYMHKKLRKSVSEIANQIGTSEEEAKDIIRKARRRLNEIIAGES